MSDVCSVSFDSPTTDCCKSRSVVRATAVVNVKAGQAATLALG